MRSYEEAYGAAREGSPFSNSTQWEMWSYNWCERCRNDSPEMVDKGEGCPLILVALNDRTPLEWLAETDEQRLQADYHCVEFRPDEDGGGEPDPEPPPVLPGQLDLFTANILDGLESHLVSPRVPEVAR